ncbi:MAG: hydrolase, partial [Maribacter sp.]|nr:hydrolase [Maribacter sp.]
MKNRIFLYLFVFAALICLFMVVSNGKMQKSMDAKIQNLQASNADLKDSLQNSQLNVLDMQYFSLENNDDALAYYDHLELEDPSRYISDKLLETNEAKG